MPSSNSSTRTEAGETEASVSPAMPSGPSGSTWGPEEEGSGSGGVGGSNPENQGLPGSGGGTTSEPNAVSANLNCLFHRYMLNQLPTKQYSFGAFAYQYLWKTNVY